MNPLKNPKVRAAIDALPYLLAEASECFTTLLGDADVRARFAPRELEHLIAALEAHNHAARCLDHAVNRGPAVPGVASWMDGWRQDEDEARVLVALGGVEALLIASLLNEVAAGAISKELLVRMQKAIQRPLPVSTPAATLLGELLSACEADGPSSAQLYRATTLLSQLRGDQGTSAQAVAAGRATTTTTFAVN
jgi:hypothetical protein